MSTSSNGSESTAVKGINYMDAKTFRNEGFLQELNRCFLHPMGMALEIIVNDETGEETFGRVWDYRYDPEGIVFNDGEIDVKKAMTVMKHWESMKASRERSLGYHIQQP